MNAQHLDRPQATGMRVDNARRIFKYVILQSVTKFADNVPITSSCEEKTFEHVDELDSDRKNNQIGEWLSGDIEKLWQ